MDDRTLVAESRIEKVLITKTNHEGIFQPFFLSDVKWNLKRNLVLNGSKIKTGATLGIKLTDHGNY